MIQKLASPLSLSYHSVLRTYEKMNDILNPNHYEILPRRRDLPCERVGNEMIVHDSDTRNIHFLNAAASVIWNECDGETTLEMCEKRLHAQFAFPERSDLSKDIIEAIADFAKKGLIDASSDIKR